MNFPFDFLNEDLVFYYINFLKTISQKYPDLPIVLFFNE